jgi:kynurenine formamidase
MESGAARPRGRSHALHAADLSAVTTTDRSWSLDLEQAALAELRTLTNWGRWGADDEIGTLNLVTPEVIRTSAGLVRRGVVFPLGEFLGRGTRRLGSVPAPLHFMTAADSMPLFGEPTTVTLDGLVINSTHGSTTHVDALCHVSGYAGSFYNGTPADAIDYAGARRLDIAKVRGVTTRGVLLDVARLRDVEAMDTYDVVTADDLERAAVSAGVEVGAGDAVLIRTGWPNAYEGDGVGWYREAPGIGPSAALWLARRDVALIGSDNGGVECVNVLRDKAGDPRAEIVQSLHPLLLANLGIHLLELLNLEELASAGIAEFQFVMAPLRIVGGTGSPVNPLAIC